jgi:hypothetical protein
MVEVFLPKAHAPEHTINFHALSQPENHERLFKYAKLLVWQALQLSPEDVYEMAQPLYSLVPEGLVDRHRNNHVLVLLGLQHLKRTLQKHLFHADLTDSVQRIQDELVKHWDLHKEKMFRRQEETEILNIMKGVSILASTRDPRGYYTLAAGTHFVLTDKVLYLDMDSCYEQYRVNLSRTRGKRAEYESVDQMAQLLEDEDYFIGFGPLPDGSSPREWLILDAAKLEQRGVKLSRFWR